MIAAVMVRYLDILSVVIPFTLFYLHFNGDSNARTTGLHPLQNLQYRKTTSQSSFLALFYYLTEGGVFLFFWGQVSWLHLLHCHSPDDAATDTPAHKDQEERYPILRTAVVCLEEEEEEGCLSPIVLRNGSCFPSSERWKQHPVFFFFRHSTFNICVCRRHLRFNICV